MTPEIAPLPRSERTVEELVRLVQECGDIIKRKDAATVSRSVAEMYEIMNKANAAPSLSRKESAELVRRLIRPLILSYLCADEIQAAGIDLDEIEGLEVPAQKPPAPRNPVKSGLPAKLVEQLQDATERAIAATDGLNASSKKYSAKAETETNQRRALVYRQLARACHDASEYHLKIARTWTDALGLLSMAETR